MAGPTCYHDQQAQAIHLRIRMTHCFLLFNVHHIAGIIKTITRCLHVMTIRCQSCCRHARFFCTVAWPLATPGQLGSDSTGEMGANRCPPYRGAKRNHLQRLADRAGGIRATSLVGKNMSKVAIVPMEATNNYDQLLIWEIQRAPANPDLSAEHCQPRESLSCCQGPEKGKARLEATRGLETWQKSAHAC